VSLVPFLYPLCYPIHLPNRFITVLLHCLQEFACKALQLVEVFFPERLPFREVHEEPDFVTSSLLIVSSRNAF
jgi:hypothetical protein